MKYFCVLEVAYDYCYFSFKCSQVYITGKTSGLLGVFYLFSNFILLGKCCFHLKGGYIALLWCTGAIVLTQHKGRVFKHAQRMFISGRVLFVIHISGSKEF